MPRDVQPLDEQPARYLFWLLLEWLLHVVETLLVGLAGIVILLAGPIMIFADISDRVYFCMQCSGVLAMSGIIMMVLLPRVVRRDRKWRS